MLQGKFRSCFAYFCKAEKPDPEAGLLPQGCHQGDFMANACMKHCAGRLWHIVMAVTTLCRESWHIVQRVMHIVQRVMHIVQRVVTLCKES